MKTLVLYVFHKDCSNLDTFIARGLIDSPDKLFIFICNNTSPDLSKWSFLHNYSNVHLYIRPNIGHDFQGWNNALFLPISSLNMKIIRDPDCDTNNVTSGLDISSEPHIHTLFNKFVFINSTVVGPYLPSYVEKNWVDCFTSKLSEEVKMVGISINFLQGLYNQTISDFIKINYGIDSREHAHIQSMAFALDREGIDILFRYGLFKEHKQFPYGNRKWELICTAEIGMSSILRHEKKSIYSYLLNQGLVKYNEVKNTVDPWWIQGLYPLCETIFTKVTSMHYPQEQLRYDNR